MKQGKNSPGRTLRGLAAVFLILVTLASSSFLACLSGRYTGPVESVTVSYSPFESTALFWIAQDRSYFSRNGLNITPRKYDTGSAALDGVTKGEVEIGVGISELPLVIRAFRKEKLRIVANMDEAELIYLVGRKDRGIEKVSDLKGKRVGTTTGTVANFHLGRLLNLSGLSIQDVVLVDLKTPAEWVNAVATGDIDAVVTAQPYAGQAKALLGANAFFQSAQAGQPVNGLIISSESWVNNHPETLSRFLSSLAQAEDYLTGHPEESKTIVRENLGLEASYMESAWPQNRFELSLDQSLILAMEDEARWMIVNNLTPEKSVPNFLEYIYTGGLRSVKPEAVGIIDK